MKIKIIAVEIITALIITAPGLPCYQALAGMNAGKGGLPASQTSIPGMPASVKPDTPPASLKIGDMPAASAEKLAVPREGPVLEVSQPASQALPEIVIEQNQAAAASEPIHPLPPKKQAVNPGKISPDADSRDSAHALRDASLLAQGNQPDQIPYFYDVARLSQKAEAVRGTVASRGQPLFAREEPGYFLPAPPKPSIKARPPQFTLRGLLIKVFVPLALVAGLLRMDSMDKNLSSKAQKAQAVQADMGEIAYASGREDMTNMADPADRWRSFEFFLLPLAHLHADIQDKWESFDIPDWHPPYDHSINMLSSGAKPASGEELKALYEKYLVEEKRLQPANSLSFGQFQTIAEEYEFYWETRQRSLSGSVDLIDSEEDRERLYFDYIHQVLGPRAQSLGVDVSGWDNKAKEAFAASETISKGRQDLHGSMIVWVVCLVLWGLFMRHASLNDI